MNTDVGDQGHRARALRRDRHGADRCLRLLRRSRRQSGWRHVRGRRGPRRRGGPRPRLRPADAPCRHTRGRYRARSRRRRRQRRLRRPGARRRARPGHRRRHDRGDDRRARGPTLRSSATPTSSSGWASSRRLPLADASVDVAISNCVLNLVPDKAGAFAEIFRVLRPGAHFCISDIVASAPLPDAIRAAAELHVGCVAGAIEQEQYLDLIRAAGFSEVRIAESRTIELPDASCRSTSTENNSPHFGPRTPGC